jgi:hypothetical protein
MTVANLSLLQLCLFLLAKIIYLSILELLKTEHVIVELLRTSPSLSEKWCGTGCVQVFVLILHIVSSLCLNHWAKCAFLKFFLSHLLLYILDRLFFFLSLKFALVIQTDISLRLIAEVKSLLIFGIFGVFCLRDLT